MSVGEAYLEDHGCEVVVYGVGVLWAECDGDGLAVGCHVVECDHCGGWVVAFFPAFEPSGFVVLFAGDVDGWQGGHRFPPSMVAVFG